MARVVPSLRYPLTIRRQFDILQFGPGFDKLGLGGKFRSRWGHVGALQSAVLPKMMSFLQDGIELNRVREWMDRGNLPLSTLRGGSVVGIFSCFALNEFR
jgi:hypothetical protein